MVHYKSALIGFIVFVFLSFFFLNLASGFSDELVKAAVKEGSLSIYGGGTVEDMRKMISRFNERYPSLKVNYLHKQRTAIFETIVRENLAGVNNADVYGPIVGVDGLLLAQRGLLARYASPERSAIPQNLKDRDGYWTGMYGITHVYAYNTRAVDPRDVPRSHDDFLLPKWKGKIGMPEDEYEWYATMLEIMGKEKGLNFMKRLAQQRPLFQRSKSLQMQLLCAGEFSLTVPTNFNHATLAMKKGCPTDWTVIEPLTQRPPVLMAIAKTARHPAAARLFTDWFLSKEAQRFMQDTIARQAIRVDVEPTGDFLKLKGLRVWKSDWDSIFRNINAHIKAYRETFDLR